MPKQWTDAHGWRTPTTELVEAAERGRAKKPYSKPTLVVYGDAKDLTRAVGVMSSTTDGANIKTA